MIAARPRYWPQPIFEKIDRRQGAGTFLSLMIGLANNRSTITGRRSMQKALSFSGSSALALAVIGWSALPVFAQRAVLVSANVAEVGKGYPTSLLQGRKVLNDRNESIGTIAELVLGRDYALFAVLNIGGFLGIPGRLVAVPIKTLVLDDSGRHIVLPGATRRALRNFPEFKFPS